MIRVSPPELARALPGPQASMSVTRCAAAPELQRGPAAERAGADNGDSQSVMSGV